MPQSGILTTAEMGFSLTEESNAVVCTRDVKERKVNDRYLAPAISRFAVDTLMEVGIEVDMDWQAKDLKRKLEDLHQRWSTVNMIPNSEDIQHHQASPSSESGESLRHVVGCYSGKGGWESRKARGDRSPCAGAALDPPLWTVVPIVGCYSTIAGG